jgi:hypothetical protein
MLFHAVPDLKRTSQDGKRMLLLELFSTCALRFSSIVDFCQRLQVAQLKQTGSLAAAGDKQDVANTCRSKNKC